MNVYTEWSGNIVHNWWLSGKESTCNAGGDVGLIPGLGRSGGGNGNPLQYSCLENPMDRRAWQVRVHGVTKSRTRLSAQSKQGPAAVAPREWVTNRSLRPRPALLTRICISARPAGDSSASETETCDGKAPDCSQVPTSLPLLLPAPRRGTAPFLKSRAGAPNQLAHPNPLGQTPGQLG